MIKIVATKGHALAAAPRSPAKGPFSFPASPAPRMAAATSFRLCHALGISDADFGAFLAGFWDIYMGYPNEELIAWFRALRPRYRTAILSNSFVGAREQEEQRYGFTSMVELAIYSHEEGVRKPDPRIFALLCERLGCQPDEIVFLDDVERNVEAATAYGIHAILFQNNAQAIAAIEALLNGSSAG